MSERERKIMKKICVFNMFNYIWYYFRKWFANKLSFIGDIIWIYFFLSEKLYLVTNF